VNLLLPDIQSLQSNLLKFSVDFVWERDYEEPEKIVGTIYFPVIYPLPKNSANRLNPTENAVFLITTRAEGQDQYIFWQHSKMLIYYPESMRGTEIISSFPLTMPPIQGLLLHSALSSTVPEDVFSLKDVKSTSKGVLSIYEPTRAYRRAYKKLEIVREGKIVREITVETKKKVSIITTYGLLKLNNLTVPRKVMRISYQKNIFGKRKLSQDTITYLKIKSSVPERFKKFKIPENADIKTVNW